MQGALPSLAPQPESRAATDEQVSARARATTSSQLRQRIDRNSSPCMVSNRDSSRSKSGDLRSSEKVVWASRIWKANANVPARVDPLNVPVCLGPKGPGRPNVDHNTSVGGQNGRLSHGPSRAREEPDVRLPGVIRYAQKRRPPGGRRLARHTQPALRRREHRSSSVVTEPKLGIPIWIVFRHRGIQPFVFGRTRRPPHAPDDEIASASDSRPRPLVLRHGFGTPGLLVDAIPSHHTAEDLGRSSEGRANPPSPRVWIDVERHALQGRKRQSPYRFTLAEPRGRVVFAQFETVLEPKIPTT